MKINLLLSLFVVVLLFSCSQETTTTELLPLDDDTLVEVGDYAPPFKVFDLQEREFNSNKLLGKNYILWFYSAWHQSNNEAESYNTLAQKYKDDNLVVLGISKDYTLKDCKEFVKKSNLKIPIHYDSVFSGKGSLYYRYQIKSIGSSVLVNEEGKIVKFYFNYNTDLEKTVEELLK
jgi:peroxiredoxin